MCATSVGASSEINRLNLDWAANVFNPDGLARCSAAGWVWKSCFTQSGVLCKVRRMKSAQVLQPTLWRTCRVLANRTRLQMLQLLSKQPDQTVSAVAKRLNLTLPVASQYLRALEARGFLTLRRTGLRVKYRANPTTSATTVPTLVAAL